MPTLFSSITEQILWLSKQFCVRLSRQLKLTQLTWITKHFLVIEVFGYQGVRLSKQANWRFETEHSIIKALLYFEYS